MAKREIVSYVSDLSGDPIEERNPTVRFALDGTDYEIDLTRDERARLRSVLAEFVTAAKPLTSSGRPVVRTKVAANTTTIRAWAQAHGYKLPARGAVPRSVREAYDAANP